jgi:DNA polymerase-3 subunit alpha
MGHREWQREAKAAGIIPILGLEGYISQTDRFDKRSKAKREDGTNVYNHITMLAKDAEGLDTLNRLSAEAWHTGYYFKPRMDSELIFNDHKGIIVLSGCMSGLIAKAFERDDIDEAFRIAA